MNKEFIPYEPSLELKQIGFDEPCFACYSHLDHKEIWMNRFYKNGVSENISAPTFSQAFRFFREKYKLSGIPTHQSYDVWNLETGECFIEEYPIESYEEAELACLRHLIEIVKK